MMREWWQRAILGAALAGGALFGLFVFAYSAGGFR
jgi:hypothetical protein